MPLPPMPQRLRSPFGVPTDLWKQEEAVHCKMGEPREPLDAGGVLLGGFVLVDGLLRKSPLNVIAGTAMAWIHGNRWVDGDKIDCEPYYRKRCKNRGR